MRDQVQELLTLAKTCRESGDGAKLVEIFQKLQLIQPEEKNWQIAAACALAEIGRSDEAKTQISTIELSPSEATMVAGALQKGGDSETAERLLRAIVKKDPFSVDAVNQLASILTGQGKQDQASQILEKLLTRPIGDNQAAARTWFNLGVSLVDKPEAAEQAYRKALELYPEYEMPVANLGLVLTKTGQMDQAIDFLKPQAAARVDWPRTAILLSTAYRLTGNHEKAIATLDEVVDSRNEDTGEYLEMAWEILVRCLVENGDQEQAVSRCSQWKGQMPDSAVAEHMLAAVEGKAAPSRASAQYVANTFDGFAESFDSVLTHLDYRAPQLVGKLVAESLGEPKGDRVVLDAGCGTGLAGPFLRAYAKELVGVDLSGGMLAQAETRGIYDELIQADLVEHLRTHPGQYGLIAAADTFNYFGDLSELLPACFGALTDDGWLVFTLEVGETYGDSWQLETHGRYTHPPGYLMERLGECGVEEGEMITAPLRKENGVDVMGLLVAIENREARVSRD